MNELIEKINEHIKTLDPKDFPNEAINWARVRCISITEGKEWIGEETPSENITVEVVKCSPMGCHLFKQAIYQFVDAQLPNNTKPIYIDLDW